MGSASLIAAAISLILLIITAYVIVGSTISAAEIVADAQSQQAQQQEERMRTSISIESTALTMGGSPLHVQVKNTGSVIIANFDDMEAYAVFSAEPQHFPYGTGEGYLHRGTISPDSIHPSQLDPDEVVDLTIEYSGSTAPTWVQITTANGVSDSTYT